MNAATKYYVPQLRDDPLLFHSILQLSAHRSREIQPSYPVKMIPELAQKCIQLLQERVQDPIAGISDGSIGAVAILATIEVYRLVFQMLREGFLTVHSMREETLERCKCIFTDLSG